MFLRVRFIFHQSVGACLSLGIVPSLVSFPVTGAVCQSQLMISLISFSSFSVFVEVDRVAGQFRNYSGIKVVMVFGSGMHIIPSIRQNSHRKSSQRSTSTLISLAQKVPSIWKLEMCARGSISLCLHVYFLQPSSATWCLEKVSGFCGPLIFMSDWYL